MNVLERDLAVPTPDVSLGNDLAIRLVALGVALLPLSRGHGPANLAVADAAFVVSIVGVLVWAGTNRHVMRAPYLVSVGIMIVSGLIASAAGAFTRVGLIALTQDAYLLLWAIAVANVIRAPGALRVLLRVWSYAAIVSAGIMVFGTAIGSNSLAGINPSIGSRAAFTFPDENSAGLYFALSLAILLATRAPASRAARGGAVILLLSALVVTGSLAGLLALSVVCFIAITVGTLRRYGGAPALALLAALALATGGLFVGVRSTHLFDRASASNERFLRDSLGRQQQSTGSREVLISEITGLYLDGPLLGRGPASTRASLNAVAAPYTNEAHDDYLAALTERGILGAVGLLLLVGAIKVRTTALDTRSLRAEFTQVIPRPVWLLGAVASLAFVALTHEILHERTVWTLLGIVAGVHAFGLRTRAVDEGVLP